MNETRGPSEVLPLTKTEWEQLRIRVIALENLVIALLTESSAGQRGLARELAAYIAPRPGVTPHPLTIHAAAHIVQLVERVEHLGADPSCIDTSAISR